MPFSSNLNSGDEAEFGGEVPVCWNSKQGSWNGNRYWDIWEYRSATWQYNANKLRLVCKKLALILASKSNKAAEDEHIDP